MQVLVIMTSSEEVDGDLHGQAHHKDLVGEYTVNQKL